MDRLLDDPKLILAVTNDLIRSAPEAVWNGHLATPAIVTLRTAVARHLMGWGYETAHTEMAGSALWRWFRRIYDHAVPNHSTLLAREALIQPTTLHRLGDRLAGMSRTLGVTHGQKLRTDPTVIATNIHYPTDSRLLNDSARILGRAFDHAPDLLRPWTRTANNTSAIARMGGVLGMLSAADPPSDDADHPSRVPEAECSSVREGRQPV